jgi:hypothetical protein
MHWGYVDMDTAGDDMQGLDFSGAFAAQKMDIGNSSRGGGGGLTRGRGESRQALGGISDSDNNRLSLFGGASAAARAPPLSVVMRKFPTTYSQIQRICFGGHV